MVNLPFQSVYICLKLQIIEPLGKATSMFIRKLFQISDKVKWLLLELLVVFVGVYMAFLFQRYAEGQKLKDEKEKVLISLKKELEEFRTNFPGFASYQRGKLVEWDSLLDAGELTDYYNWRYLEPQYNFKVIEYAMNKEGTEIISFELYEALSKLHSRIRQLEHAERLMTNFGQRYNLVPSSLAENDTQRKILEAENRFAFYRFIGAARLRAGKLENVAELAEDILKVVNEDLGPEKTREVEISLLKNYIRAGLDVNFIRTIVDEYFPQYAQGTFDEVLKEVEQQESRAKDSTQ